MKNILLQTNTERTIPAQDIKKLYNDANWWSERKCENIAKIIEQGIAVGAWDDDELVGFARVVTDGIFRAYVEDVVVHSRLQNRGIGNELVKRLLQEIPHIDVVSLFCEEELAPFYQKQSFKRTRQAVLHRKK